jgi:hypothetical protein
MVKEAFVETKLAQETLNRIGEINTIIEEYQAQGLRLSLRQLYYVFVSRGMIPNEQKQYDRLGDVLAKGRLAGLVDWDAIEDRNRVPFTPTDWLSLTDLTEQALKSYRLPRWEGQKRYVEIWVEKSALAGVLEPITREYHVTLMVNRGYSSVSAMYESAKRYLGAIMGVDPAQCKKCQGSGTCFVCDGDGIDPNDGIDDIGTDASCSECKGEGRCRYCRGAGARPERRKEPWLFYIGDHDPSGEDMVRDIKERMVMLGVDGIRVFKIAMTMAQIERYNPVPNPVKVQDSRATDYINKYGDECWEVDALPPNVLAQIVRDALDRCIDRPRMDAIITRENADRERLRKAVAKLE